MKIPHKAAYHLLDRFYARRSFNGFIQSDISLDIFNAALIFAQQKEDYKFLASAVTQREEFDRDYCFFTGPGLENPIILKKDQDLTVIEFAILYKNCGIHISAFVETVNSIAENERLDAEKIVNYFKSVTLIFQPEPEADE